MNRESIITAGELVPGDVILTEGFDHQGMSTTHRFPVTKVTQYTHKVRVFTDARPVSLPKGEPVRIVARLPFTFRAAEYGTIGGSYRDASTMVSVTCTVCGGGGTFGFSTTGQARDYLRDTNTDWHAACR